MSTYIPISQSFSYMTYSILSKNVKYYPTFTKEELMLLNCGVGKDSWESLGLQGDPTSQPWRKSVLNIHWKYWCWSWNSNTLATWHEELTHWKRPWCWERLKTGGEGDDRGWDGWMASLTQWTWVWASSVSWWWTGKPCVLQSIGLQRVGQDWMTELNRTELSHFYKTRNWCLNEVMDLPSYNAVAKFQIKSVRYKSS